jgi:hypothetical protein
LFSIEVSYRSTIRLIPSIASLAAALVVRFVGKGAEEFAVLHATAAFCRDFFTSLCAHDL